MRIDILTLFPQMFEGPFSHGVFQRAREAGFIDLQLHNIRDYTHDKHHVVDDAPYGGGAGMLIKPEPVFEAAETVNKEITAADASAAPEIILLSPAGRSLTAEIAQELSGKKNIIFICGHYEGIDERVSKYLATDEISVGDYVLSGGEIAAMVAVNAIARFIPGVLGSEESPQEESHTDGLLEYPHYTRPSTFRSHKIPEVLLSGNHAEIKKWRRQQSLLRTAERRPDLLAKLSLSKEDKILLREAGYNEN
jgi:tRNA (guanine37-N1)-methyltransferase